PIMLDIRNKPKLDHPSRLESNQSLHIDLSHCSWHDSVSTRSLGALPLSMLSVSYSCAVNLIYEGLQRVGNIGFLAPDEYGRDSLEWVWNLVRVNLLLSNILR